MQRGEWSGPLVHLALVSGLIVMIFLVCEMLHLLDPMHEPGHVDPHVHLIFLPHGMFVLLAWIYGWAMVPLVLPALLVSAAFTIGPEHMTPVVAGLAVARLVLVMGALEVLRALGRDARGDTGRAGLVALFAAGLLSSLAFNLLRVMHSPCCTMMTGAERVVAYALAVGADLVGIVLVMMAAMFVFRALRH
jgi:hypothetical protein